ncbi:MAG TPA: hydantoinase/oxoprolinase N-terminal domain-containing protein [Desulfohalobiaceae bacterium]|nr:hydantoinase/oxoprolinase N-terminal domain-containing protein [Desulfohalobiaceae bacterium]
MVIVGVDTGGGFTDFVYKKDGQWGVYNLLSTPDNPTEAVIQGLSKTVEVEEMQVVHGSTVATNAILKHRGVKTTVITKAGSEDILQIGRNREDFLIDRFLTIRLKILF